MAIDFSLPPFHWKRISIRNFRILKRIDLERPVQNLDRGQWTLLIGENGVGKTSFLQAIATLGPFPARLRMEVPLSNSPDVTTSVGITPAGESDQLHAARRVEFRQPIWAYGSQRGNALGGPDRASDPQAVPPLDGLFDPNWRLIHAETWLKNLQLAAFQNGLQSKQLLDAVKATLISILPDIVDINIRSEGVSLTRQNDNEVPLRDWSDGYLTTAGWILDLIAHWIEYAKKRRIPIQSDFREQMVGLVLIDEIDLHLHPAWQTQIVRDLRRLFPRLSFIATTHNPLTLLGAEPGEIFVLRRNAEGEIEALQRDIPPGSDVDRVLTGDWFGLSSTLDSGTLDLLDRHRTLLRSGSPPQAPERRELEVELRQRLGSYGETAVDRIVQDVAADLLPPTSKNLAPAERSALRDKILSIASKKLE